MAPRDEWIKYLTEHMVRYIETPSELKKHSKMRKKAQQEHWSIRWFGMIPMALSMMVRKYFPAKTKHLK